jgi:hypothetical protein
MIICSPCRKEMTCVCTGKMAVWNGSHVYSGDEFRCLDCNATVTVTTSTPYRMENALMQPARKVLDMDTAVEVVRG